MSLLDLVRGGFDGLEYSSKNYQGKRLRRAIRPDQNPTMQDRISR